MRRLFGLPWLMMLKWLHCVRKRKGVGDGRADYMYEVKLGSEVFSVFGRHILPLPPSGGFRAAEELSADRICVVTCYRRRSRANRRNRSIETCSHTNKRSEEHVSQADLNKSTKCNSRIFSPAQQPPASLRGIARTSPCILGFVPCG